MFSDLFGGKASDSILAAVKKLYDEGILSEDIIDYGKRHQSEDYDWRGLQNYISTNLFKNILDSFVLPDKHKRDALTRQVYQDAYKSAKAKLEEQRLQVKEYVDDIMDIIKESLNRQLTNFYGQNVVIDEILKDIDSLREELKAEFQKLMKELLARIKCIEDKKKFLTIVPHNPRGGILHRDSDINNLRDKIQQDSRILIHGFGGVGKTTVAQHLFHKLKDEYQYIAWVPYNISLKESLLKVWELDKELKDEETRYSKIISNLNETTEDTVIIIDDYKYNPDTPDEDFSQLSGIDAKIIVTSRTPKISGYKSIEIKDLSEDQCIDVFYHYYDYDENRENIETVRKLVKLVKYHTLSVELVSMAANDIDYSIEEYLETLKNNGFEYHDLKVSTSQSEREKLISEHLKILFNMITVSDEQAAILKNFVVMPDMDIPFAVRTWLGCNPNDLNRLIKLGWLQKSDKGYSMHTIVKKAIALQYEVTYDDCRTIMLYMAEDEYIKEDDIYTDVHIRLNIAQAFLEKFSNLETDEFSEFCSNIAMMYFRWGDYLKALKWNEKALDIRENIFGKEHIDTINIYNNIAGIYFRQGNSFKALELYQKALLVLEKTLDKEHFDIAVIYNNIAVVYDAQGDYVKALRWYQSALEIREKVLDKEHPAIASIYNNIALMHSRQRDYYQALEWYQKALEIREKILGKEHPATAASYNDIAKVYDSQGNYIAALEWYQKALEIREKILGKEHPDTALTYNNIAEVYDSQGNYQKALEVYQDALVISEKVLGEEHPITATIYNNIAVAYNSLEDYSKALEWYQKALKIREEMLGKNHPDTAVVYNNIAVVYYNQGYYKSALEWYQKALVIREKVRGGEHFETAMNYNSIAMVYDNLGDYPKALEWYLKAFGVFERVLGNDHPHTKLVRENIARVLSNQE